MKVQKVKITSITGPYPLPAYVSAGMIVKVVEEHDFTYKVTDGMKYYTIAKSDVKKVKKWGV